MGSLNLEKINVLKQDISDDVKLVQTEVLEVFSCSIIDY